MNSISLFQLGVDASSAMANDTIYQIQQQLNVLKKSTQECGIEIEKTRQMQEHHSINFYKHHQISGMWNVSASDIDSTSVWFYLSEGLIFYSNSLKHYK